MADGVLSNTDADCIKAFFTFKILYLYIALVITFIPRVKERQLLIGCDIIEFHPVRAINLEIAGRLLFASLNKGWNSLRGYLRNLESVGTCTGFLIGCGVTEFHPFRAIILEIAGRLLFAFLNKGWNSLRGYLRNLEAVGTCTVFLLYSK